MNWNKGNIAALIFVLVVAVTVILSIFGIDLEDYMPPWVESLFVGVTIFVMSIIAIVYVLYPLALWIAGLIKNHDE